jgi:rhamnulose-1-phosphate aldolase
MGEAGRRLSDMKATEGAAGNISVYVGWGMEVRYHFPEVERIALPQAAPALAGKMVLVTGSGCRLRDIETDPAGTLAAVVVDAGGETAQMHTSAQRRFKRVTSEFNTHLAAHEDAVARTGADFQALVHAQPPNVVYLSHIEAYREQAVFNRRLMRWEPETIIELPTGVGVLPFIVPGSEALMEATVGKLREHDLVMWSKHGVMARSDRSLLKAVDLVEYAEAAARYEYMDLAANGRADGLSAEELGAVARAFGVSTKLIP